VPSADFNDLANIAARLGNYFWLGFIITGLSPDKKRPAWHGAPRLSIAKPDGRAHMDKGVEVVVSDLSFSIFAIDSCFAIIHFAHDIGMEIVGIFNECLKATFLTCANG
jgi:hypothetical protein